MLENLLAGFISGLVVTLFVVVFNKLWKSVITPWFEERIYKDVYIEGKWFSLYPHDRNLRQETISLERQGHSITGTIICTYGPDEGEQYSVQGSFRNLILPLVYETFDKSKTDRGTITLKSTYNGEKLAGQIAHYDTKQDQIKSGEVMWFRSKKAQESVIQQIKENREKLELLKKQQAEAEAKMHEFQDNIININPTEITNPEKNS